MHIATNLKNIVLTTIAIAIVAVLPHLGLIPLPFGYTIPILLFLWLFLKFNKESFSDLGLEFKKLSLHSFMIGTISGVFIFSFLYYVFFPILEFIVVLPETKVDFYDTLKGNPGLYIFLLVMGWLVGGIYEEIVFHGFIFTYIEKFLPRSISLYGSFIITSILFGLYHFQLGYDGVINAFLAGIGYHVVILMNKRNLWYGIICHAIFDTIALTMLYLGYI